FNDVTFGYEPERPIIKNLNLKILPGETVAFVGSTGAGKTTIANLLLRFYEPQSGRITLDGINIADVAQKSLRENIGLVQQDVFLFSDSVSHNIGYGRAGASKEEIHAAATSAAADEFIQQLPNGYDTEIGERGVKLSGGQKQRLAIARAFLKNPKVLVFDEATSALDNKTEKQIQEKLEMLSKGRTTLIIAHRLSTIQKADKIVVLKNGTVVEQGRHEELLNKKGAYYELYNAA
ncbi:MAG: ATP-binding cassette domain-containing protein, partial [Phascolarctobacterium sp.]|nr:ATP-binding cassette domain-containing protein [Phascolarctobacterium sp.]